MAVSEAVLGAFLQVLFHMITDPMMELFTKFLGLDKQVKGLKDLLPTIQTQIKRAGEEADKEWLDKLKDAAYDMEDILDEINTQYLLLDVDNRKQGGEPLGDNLDAVRSRDKKSRFPIYSAAEVGKFFKHAVGKLRNPTKKKIQDALAKLEEAAKSRDTLGLGRNTARGEMSENPTRGRIQTFPLRDDPVYGRRDDRQKLLDMIGEETSHSPSGVNYSVVTILGMGGIGKTALARSIYNDVADLFDLRSWVFAPSIGHEYSLEILIRDILSQLPNFNNQHGGSNLSLVSLLTALKRCFKDKKFLIVIDDVWTVDINAWRNLYAAFQDCGKGSKVVVTTQKEDVANMMGSKDLHRLQKLEDKHCCEFFMYEAFGSSSAEVRRTEIEKEIAEKCKGVPLVADVLGTIFKGKDPRNIRRKDISDADIWNCPDDNKNIFRHLKMCYYDLPSDLKRCFEYFSLFPEDYFFNQDNLVQMWLAEGFVLPKRVGSKLVEYYMNSGGNHYEELKKRSLLCDDGKMPELLHSLACYIAGNFYHKHDNHLISLQGLHIISPRHVSFLGKNIAETALDSLKGFMKLRTILVNSIPSNCLDRLLASNSTLRVLELGNSGLSVLPPSIGEQKHLRYLSLHSCNIESLPDAIRRLCNLQTLDLHSCVKLAKLPDMIGDLVSLHHLILHSSDIGSLPDTICCLCNLQTLDLHSCVKLTKLPDMIGDLVSLHHLNLRGTGLLSLPNSICGATKLQSLIIDSCFNLTKMPPHLGNLTDLRHLSNYLVSAETDYGIRELKRLLIHLKEPLIISGLEHVTVVDDAENAPSKQKGDLEGVKYVWSHNRQASDPPSIFPDKNALRALELSSCRLKSLSIDGYGGDDFPEWLWEMTNLTHLILDSCSNITSLPDQGLAKLKSLRSLQIKNCCRFNSELQPLLNAVHNLKFLHLLEVKSTYNFGWTSTELWIEKNGAITCLPSGLHSLTSLQRLRITDCSQLQSLCEGPLPTTLEELCITGCQNLQSLQCEFLDRTSLRSLEIANCEQLGSVCEDGLPATLEKLCITGCQNLQSLQCKFLDRTSLRSLKINNCEQLGSVCEDGLPATLIELRIQNCSKLQSLPQRLDNLTAVQCLKVNGSSKMYPLLRELCRCPSLKRLGVDYNHLQSLLEERLCFTLERLYVWGDEDSSPPAGWLQNLTSLSKLKIAAFPRLSCMPNRLPTSLKIFSCYNCPNLSSINALTNLTNLKKITVRICPLLEFDLLVQSFPDIDNFQYKADQ